jgi:hypothetical protein
MNSNIFLWVMSWWGPIMAEEGTIQFMLKCMEEEESTDDFPIGDFQVSMFCETIGRIQEINSPSGIFYDINNVKSDIRHIASQYFGHPNYLKIDDKPVLFVHLSRWLHSKGLLKVAIKLMRKGASEAGYEEIYIVGDHAYNDPSELPEQYEPFTILDAVTNYDVYGSMGRPLYAGQEGVEAYISKQKGWSSKEAKETKCDFIPSITPGYNEMGVRNLGRNPMSRKLEAGADEGSLFRTMLESAMDLADEDTGNILMINSFNEWHEDTQIEPVKGLSYGTPTNSLSITNGIEYEPYGMTYLNIVRKLTTYWNKNPPTPSLGRIST